MLARTAGYEIRLARDAAGRRLVAKSPRRDAARQLRLALEREHACLSGLDSPHVVATAGFVDSAHGPTLLLEYLGGGDLVSLRGFAARHWLEAARDVAAGLADIHAAGFAHRDVKARNVRFADDGRAVLIDLGSAARLGAACSSAGTTAAYRRTARNRRRVAIEDDVHAFAVLLYELMTGRLPFGAAPSGPSSAPPLPPSVASDELAALVARTLDPVAEPVELEAFAAAIDSALHGLRGAR